MSPSWSTRCFANRSRHRIAWRRLQRTPSEAAEALDTAVDCRVEARPLLARHKGVWVLSAAALGIVEGAAPRSRLRRRGVLPYRRPDDPLEVVRRWLATQHRITSGDHALLTGLTQTGALNLLERLVEDGVLVRGPGEDVTLTSSLGRGWEPGTSAPGRSLSYGRRGFAGGIGKHLIEEGEDLGASY